MKIFVCLFILLFAAPALADDWRVNRVRGDVTQQVKGAWQAVQRGDPIPNNRYLKTGGDGHIGLSRGAETIELQGNTQIRIMDAGADLMTTVLQDFGTVSIEAERRNVQHFSVQTPFLAAVVKGTRFTVRSDARGATVEVNRGVVQVQDTVHDLVVDVRPGQAATVTEQAPLLVEGVGAVAVFSFEGVPVVNGTTTEVSTSETRASGNSASSNAGGNGKGNAYGLSEATGEIESTVNGNGNSASSNAGGNGKSNAGGNSNGNSSSNAGSDSAAVNSVVSAAEEVTGNNAGGNGRGNAYGLSKHED